MPIDQSGMSPGLKPAEKSVVQHNMKCKYPDCDSISAIEIRFPNTPSGQRVYECTKCHRHAYVQTGGGFDL